MGSLIIIFITVLLGFLVYHYQEKIYRIIHHKEIAATKAREDAREKAIKNAKVREDHRKDEEFARAWGVNNPREFRGVNWNYQPIQTKLRELTPVEIHRTIRNEVLKDFREANECRDSTSKTEAKSQDLEKPGK